MAKQTILFIGAGVETVPGIQQAKEMGLHVVASDYNSAAPGFQYSDAKLIASTYDAKATIAAVDQYQRCTNNKIDGVMCLATDVPHTVAAVANAFGLPGISQDVADLMVDKMAMKDHFKQHDIPLPWYQEIYTVAELENMVNEHSDSLIIKPVDSRGARGVLQIKHVNDLEWAFNEAKRNSPAGRVMLESYMAGPQISTESIVFRGKAYTVGFSSRNYEYLERFSPYIIENGGDLPGDFTDSVRDEVDALMQAVADSLKLESGILKGDVVIHNGRAHIIEVAARLSGGYFCTHEIPLNTGVDFVGNAIKLALGEELDPAALMPKYNRPVCQRYLFVKPGRVLKIDASKLDDLPGLEFVDIRINPGDVITQVNNHTARAGMVIASAKTPELARRYAEGAVGSIEVVVETYESTKICL